MSVFYDHSEPRRSGRGGSLARRFVPLFWLVVLVTGLYAAIGYGLLPRVIQTQMLPLASHYLAGSLAAHHVSVNPFTLELHLQGLEVRDEYGDLLASVADLVIDLDLGAWWSRELRFERIHLSGPWLHVVREEGGGINLARLVKREVREVLTVGAQTAAPYRLRIDEFAVINGVAKVTDNRDLTPATATLLPISFTVRDLTTDPEARGSNVLRIGLAGGGTLFWQGNVSLRPLRAAGELRVLQLSARVPWHFLRDELKIAEPRGRLDLTARYEFEWRDLRPTLTVSDLQADLSNLVLRTQDAPRPFLRVARASLRDGHYRLSDNAFSAAELLLDKAMVEAAWRDGSFDWQAILARDPPRDRFDSPTESLQRFAVAIERVGINGAAFKLEVRDQPLPLQLTIDQIDGTCRFRAERASSGQRIGLEDLQIRAATAGLRQEGGAEALLVLQDVNLGEASVDFIGRHVEFGELTIEDGQGALQLLADGTTNWSAAWGSRSEDALPRLELASWRVDLRRGLIKQLAVDWLDRNPQPPVRVALDPVRLSVSELVYPFVRPVRFELSATPSMGGEITLDGAVRLDMGSVEGGLAVDQLPLAPLTPYLNALTRLEVGQGTLFARGTIAYGENATGGLRFKGRTQIRELALREPGGATLFGWQELTIPDLAMQLQPPHFEAALLELARPALAWDIRTLGTNVWQGSAVAGKPAVAAGADAPSDGASRARLDFGQVRIADGALDVKDSGLQPPFTGRLHGLNGTIADISTTVPKTMRVDLQGRVDQQGTVEVQGQADPLDLARRSTFDLRFQDLDMAGLAPYSVRLAGQEIEAGKLSLTLSYQLEDRQLSGKHRILVNGLVLGAEVAHPERTKVPLELAKALLQDRKGQIVLAFPITGDLSDPQFSYPKLLWQTIGRRLAATVASPFSALGAKLEVQVEGISEIMFAIGRSDLAPREREKLTAIADVLRARPALQLIVRPRFVPQHESNALRRQTVNRALAERLEVSTLPTDERHRVVFEQPAVREALEGLFTRRFGVGVWAQANRQLPQDEMPQQRYLRLYERLAATESLPNNALKQLAIKRAQTVVKALRDEGRLTTARIRQEAPTETAVATDEDLTFVAIELNLAATD